MATTLPTGWTVGQAMSDEQEWVRHHLAQLEDEDQVYFGEEKRPRDEILQGIAPVVDHFVGDNIVYVCRDLEGRARGLCWCVLVDPGSGLEGEVAALYVEEDARGRGVASALVGRAVELFRMRGVTFASVWTGGANEAAAALYRRHGFDTPPQTVLVWYPGPVTAAPKVGSSKHGG